MKYIVAVLKKNTHWWRHRYLAMTSLVGDFFIYKEVVASEEYL